MIRHSIFALLAACFLAAGAGCCCLQQRAIALSGCTGCGGVGCDSCGMGGHAGEVYDDCGSCGEDCGGCGTCRRSCWGFPIFHYLFSCNGCGETYWDEWRNDPPSCCDPCDCHGNWTGGPGGYSTPYETGPYMEHEMEDVPSSPTPAAESKSARAKRARTASRVVRYSGRPAPQASRSAYWR